MMVEVEKRGSKDGVNRINPSGMAKAKARPGTSVKVYYTAIGYLYFLQTLASHSENLPTSTLIRDEIDPSPSPPNTRFAETFFETNDGFMATV
jgi:hypothetical protein